MTHEITALNELRRVAAAWRAAGKTVALVPTMGALHAGHISLVEAAKHAADHVVVSIFVNPTQFGPNEDFHKYPRPLADDLALLQAAGADAAWVPSVETMYPQGFATTMRVAGVTEGLCGASRPGHFDGVATVVAKLLNQVQPDMALFGEKDFQQLTLIKRLVTDLDMPIKIIGVPTLREGDGLALSSRNRYLSEAERAIAPALKRHMELVIAALKAGAPAEASLAAGRLGLEKAGFTRVEYLELRDAQMLQPLTHLTAPARIFAAAWLGTTRLIDNMAL